MQYCSYLDSLAIEPGVGLTTMYPVIHDTVSFSKASFGRLKILNNYCFCTLIAMLFLNNIFLN